jgi:hypothetical protein
MGTGAIQQSWCTPDTFSEGRPYLTTILADPTLIQKFIPARLSEPRLFFRSERQGISRSVDELKQGIGPPRFRVSNPSGDA